MIGQVLNSKFQGPLNGSFKLQQKANSSFSKVQRRDLEHMTGIYKRAKKKPYHYVEGCCLIGGYHLKCPTNYKRHLSVVHLYSVHNLHQIIF